MILYMVNVGKKLFNIRKKAALAAALGCAFLMPFTSYADMVSDSPVISSGISSGTSTGISSEISTGTSSGNSSSECVSSGPVISDAPLVSDNNAKAFTDINVQETKPAETAAAETKQADIGIPDLKPAEKTGTDSAKTGQTLPVLDPRNETDTSKEKTGKTVDTLPSLVTEAQTKPAAETEKAAPTEIEKAAVAELPSVEQTASSSKAVLTIGSLPVAETKAAAAVSAPQPQNVSSADAGKAHANDSVTRVYLGFSLISPAHKNGSSNAARASIRLSNGTWQKFDYKEHIRYPFYKMSSQGTDSDGDNCYIASVHARRFGDSSSDDGEMKTELYLKASDCSVRDYIDISTTSQKRIAIVKAALSMLGKQYVYGGNGPDAYDCSGLVKAVMAEAGISVPRTSTQLLSMSGQISASELRPGDIMARAGHCGIYIGNGIFVHASDSSVGVIAEYLSVYNQVNKFTNCINVVGD